MNTLYRIKDITRNLRIANFSPLDVLVVGGTGAGKSSTINAMFSREVATVGRGCDPETSDIKGLSLNANLRFWDTPGLGDGRAVDRQYSEKLIETLYKDYYLDGYQFGFVDCVLVIVDGTGRDMGTTYRLLNEIIIPNFQKERIFIAVNQADMAMKGHHWNMELQQPDNIEKMLDAIIDNMPVKRRELVG